MKNSLGDLNNILFEAIERLNDDECMTPQLAEAERRRAKSIAELGKVIVMNASVQLEAIKTADDLGIGRKELPDVLQNKNEKLLEAK